MKKILFIIIDGLGDKPIKALGNKTPLEAAKTPNLDWLAKNGICGLVEPFYTMAIPTSEESHFSLFGYNSKKYQIRRGIFTVTGAQMKLKKDDVALRGNFATVGKNLNIVDRRAGRITNTKQLIKALDGMKVDGVNFLIAPAGEHRIGIIMRGKNLSSQISDGDPHYSSLGRKAKKIVPQDYNSPTTQYKRAEFTARVLNKFLEKSHQILKGHPLNKKRKKQGLLPANFILVRGASSLKKIPSFSKKYGLRACCIAGKLLYKQIGKFLGMDLINVKGTNGLPSTNLKGKFLAVKRVFKKYDFVFLHIKATDSLAEDGNFKAKKQFIEKIDKNLKFLFNYSHGPIRISRGQRPSEGFSHALKNTLIVTTADHSTCCSLKRHCREPIPAVIYGNGRDSVKEFSEKACKKGKLGKIDQLKLMSKILKMK